MSLALTAISMLVATFLAAAIVGFLTIGRSSKTGQARSRRAVPRPADSLADVVNELRSRLERLETRVFDSPPREAAEGKASTLPENPAAAESNPPDLESAVVDPDIERQLRAFVAQIRREHEDAADAAGQGSPGAGAEQEFVTASQQDVAAESRHHDAAPGGEVAFIERRARLRHSFLSRQWVAPYNGSSIPGPDDFLLVQCSDISSVGISFFLDSDPECQMLVIRLASPRGPKYMTARVRRVTLNDAGRLGKFTVGCQFLGTIHRDALPAWLNTAILRRESLVLVGDPQAPLAAKA